LEFDAQYRALCSRDRRFDGRFFVAVMSTGVYCRPSCPAITPKRRNVRFYATAAAAQSAGYRACLRCQPHAAPGSPDWNRRGDLAARALGMIADGVVDREGVTGLARRLAYSERHLHRQLLAELGAGPIALARAQRAQTARLLIQTSNLRLIDIAHAAGFSSVRQFNDTIKATYGRTPTELRHKGHPAHDSCAGADTVTVRLAYRDPIDWRHILGYLDARAVAGVEEITNVAYRRTLRLPRGYGVAEMVPVNGHIQCKLRLQDIRDLTAAVQRSRRLLDLDTDTNDVDEHLQTDPLLGPLVRNSPGLRVPGAVDGAELAIRAVLGQQVSVAAARTTASRLTSQLGDTLPVADGTLTHLFPSPQAIAEAHPDTLPGPRTRRQTLQRLSCALASDELVIDAGSDRDEVRSHLLAIKGIGSWTADYIAMRALADPDAFLPTDLAVKRALAQLGQPTTASHIAQLAQHWRPWRAYALQHLWATLAQ
jgi:AraC family transcriptional regulator, regulatory protein of adaptative response / DNA-3-methyladenine glycosylase II